MHLKNTIASGSLDADLNGDLDGDLNGSLI